MAISYAPCLRVLSAVRVVLTAVRPLCVLAVACVLCVLVCPAVLLCWFFFLSCGPPPQHLFF